MVDEVGTNTSEKAASSSDAASTESVSEETKDSSEISLESTYSKEKSFWIKRQKTIMGFWKGRTYFHR